MIVMELDRTNKITNATVFPKVHNNIGISSGLFMSLYTSAILANATGRFDYGFTTVESGNTNFNIVYRDYLRKEGIEKLTYSNIRYVDGKFTSDKISINSKADVMKVFPAKAGSIMIFEYFKKEKRIDVRLEKLG